MIDVGLGEKHVNSLLSALNIPTISPRSIKCRERELVPHLSEMAEETCRKSLEEEVSMYVISCCLLFYYNVKLKAIFVLHKQISFCNYIMTVLVTTVCKSTF